MSIAKKVVIATVMAAALATSALIGAKYNKPINGAVSSAKTKISKVFSKDAESKAAESTEKSLPASTTTASNDKTK